MKNINAIKNDWQSLYFLNIYRILLSGFLSSLFYFDIDVSPLGELETQLFHSVSLIYFSFSLFSNFTINKQWPSFFFQTHVQLLIDIIAIFLLTHSSGGITSNVSLLLLVPISAGSIFQLRLMSYFYAALASILLLIDQFYLLFLHNIPPSYSQAGILGGILFFTALITHYLARKLHDTEALASQRGDDLLGMENLAKFVMQRLQVPMIVVDKSGFIKLKNEASSTLASRLKKKNLAKLSDLSPSLSQLFKQWLKNNKQQSNSFFLENSSIEMLPQFSLLQKKHKNDIIIFLEDVSQLNQQAQQQKLASLGRLTASIAHEIRNPLAAISHAGELLSESQNIDQSDQRLTQIIDQQSKRLDEIIDTVLNLSRRNQINLEHIKLNDWLNNFLTNQIHFPSSNVTLEIEENFEIYFDKQHLQQILANLLQNALHYSSQNNQPATVCIKIYKAFSICIDVLNEGERISPEDEKHLFEPFFTTKTTGTGLGLYMAKELASLNHASLHYIAMQDKTCFRISFACG